MAVASAVEEIEPFFLPTLNDAERKVSPVESWSAQPIDFVVEDAVVEWQLRLFFSTTTTAQPTKHQSERAASDPLTAAERGQSAASSYPKS